MASPPSVQHSDLSAATHELLTAVGQNPINKLLKLARKGEINDEVVANCWQAFGSYVARLLRAGKGVQIPKFGNFSFSSSDVDLAGTTNPASRDLQRRSPIFLISKDFLPRGKPLRAGVSHSSGIRPTELKGVNGAIPLTKATFVDIALMASVPKDVCRVSLQRIFTSFAQKVLSGENVRMDIPHVGTLHIRNHIAAVTFLPELLEDVRGATVRVHTNKLFANDVTRSNLKVIEGHHSLYRSKGLVPEPIKALALSATPYYTTSTPGRAPGRPATRDQLFAAGGLETGAMRTIDHFFHKSSQSLTPHRRPQTAGARRGSRPGSARIPQVDQAYLKRLLSRMGKLRFAMKDQDTFGSKVISRKQFESLVVEEDPAPAQEQSAQLATLIKLTSSDDGKAVRYEQFFQRLPALARESRSRGGGGGAPAEEYGSVTSLRRGLSARSSRALGEGLVTAGEVQIFALAIELNRRKEAILERAQSGALRAKMTPSEMYSTLKKTELLPHLNLAALQGLLREVALYNPELGLNSSTLLELVKRVKPYIENGGRYIATFTGEPEPPELTDRARGQQALDRSDKAELSTLTDALRDLFYNEKRTLRDIFKSFASPSSGGLDARGFEALVTKFSTSLPPASSELALGLFSQVSGGRASLSLQEFERAFQWKVPYSDSEVVALHRLKHWLYTQKLNAEDAYNRILGHRGGRQNVKTLGEREAQIRRQQFVSFIRSQNLGLSAPQVDVLFRALDPDGDGFIDFGKFESKLYGGGSVAGDALAQLREVVVENAIKPDDLLRKMKLYVWDGPFEYAAFAEHLRKLEPGLSGAQLRKMFKQLAADGKVVQLATLMRNLCGEAFETVDYYQKQLKQLYDYLARKPQARKELERACERADQQNLGTLEPKTLKTVLSSLGLPLDEPELARLIRQVPRDATGRLDYLAMLENMDSVANKNHNPLRTVVARLKRFLEANKFDAKQAIRVLGGGERGLDNFKFAQFLAKKVDKTRSLDELLAIVELIDIDKDGLVGVSDLETCVGNLGSQTFFKRAGGGGRHFFPTRGFDSSQHLSAVCATVKNAISAKRLPIAEVFTQLDSNKDGLLSFVQFSQGMGKFVQLAQPVKQKLFATMDPKRLGVVDFETFVQTIQQGTFAVQRREKQGAGDSFKWQERAIQAMRDWIRHESLTPQEAFKNFDHNFDGLVDKADLRWGLENILDISGFNDIQLDRLLMLLDSRKRGSLRLQDFARLSGDLQIPADDSATSSSCLSWGRPDYEWKEHAKQQIGLTISKRFASVESSFETASQKRCDKVTFEQFCAFLNGQQALHGFNITRGLLRELFGYLDPHKKGYLSALDWTNAFSGFNWSRQVLEEFQSALAANFPDVVAAFAFFAKGGNAKSLNQDQFARGVHSLTARRFKPHEVDALWSFVTAGESALSQLSFHRRFAPLRFTGASTAAGATSRASSSRRFGGSSVGARSKSLVSLRSSTAAVWDTTGVFQRLKGLLRASQKDLSAVFKKLDKDGSGKLSQLEFRNGVRQLGLGLSSREIDNILARLDSNSDGMINYAEFAAKLRPRQSDVRILDRSRAKLDQLRELLCRHLISPRDAFARFDASRTGKLSYADFAKLVNTAYSAGALEVPSYPVLKDLFDIVDIRKDGIIDLSEWLSSFKIATVPRPSSSKPQSRAGAGVASSSGNEWEGTREFEMVVAHIGRNRKMLAEQFAGFASGEGLVSVDRAVRVLRDSLLAQVGALNEAKMKVLLRAGERDGKVDYRRLLEVYKERVGQRVAHPRSAWD